MAEAQYQDFPQVMTSKGAVARYAFDRCPEGTFLNLQNWESRQENALSSRLGRVPLTSSGGVDFPLADTDIRTLAYMRGLGSNMFRYAGAGSHLYRRAGSAGGAFTNIPLPSYYTNFGYGFSGNRFSSSQYRPDFNANPWIFFADENAMVKDSGSLSPLNMWGIFAPVIPPFAQVFTGGLKSLLVNDLIIEDFSQNTGFIFTNCSFSSIAQNISTTINFGNIATGFTSLGVTSAVGILPYAVLKVGAGSDLETILNSPLVSGAVEANFQYLHLAGEPVVQNELLVNLTAVKPAIITKSVNLNLSLSGTSEDNNDFITLFVYSGSANVVGGTVEIDFDVNDGTFTDFYHASAAIPAAGALPVKIQRSAFVAAGAAGTLNFTWANVSAWRIQVTAAPNSGTFGLAGLAISGFGGPDASVGGSVPYDYRITYFNINTGAESNPSVPWVTSRDILPANQPVNILWTGDFGTIDPQVTHVRIYRRGGFLTAGWYFVAQVPVLNGAYVDGFTDTMIASNQLLQIDNDPPVTTTLPVSVNTTISAVPFSQVLTVTPASMANIFPNQVLTVDVGQNQEQVIVKAITNFGTTFDAYFQLTHEVNTPISASTRIGTPMPLAGCAFEQMWLAGDPNNPNRLYYSKRTRPESFPPQNYIEIGVPSDPIAAVVVLRGQIFVFTTARVYRVVVYPGIAPTAYPTSSRHGLACRWAWCIAEAQIFYRSADGIYVFNGDDSAYVSQLLEWLFMKKEPNIGPMPTDTLSIQPLDLDNQNSFMAYNKNEIFYSYIGQIGSGAPTQVRGIFDWTYKRWRNDTCDFTAMNTEEDTQLFVVGRNNGMIYFDRTGNVDLNATGSPAPIPLNLETPALDQGFPKNNKVYNEFTVDTDPNGQSLTATLIFDKGRQTEDSSQVFLIPNDIGRNQYQFQVKDGKGFLAKTISLQVTGGVTDAVALYEWHIKAAVDAEFRASMDIFWSKQGTDEWKVMKQGYFEYVSKDLQGISVAVFFDGADDPAFTFNLPQSAPFADPNLGKTRTVKRVRFPAFKYRTWRLVATSAQNFQMYGESFVEWKPATTDKGYAKQKFGNVSAQGSV